MADANMYLLAMKETMVIICCRDRYKNGAFSDIVTQKTHLLNDLKALIASPLLSDQEKRVFSKAKEDVVYMRNTQAHGQMPDMLRFFMAGNTSEAMQSVVHADMRARGLYVPPMMFQVIREDRRVTRSTLIGDDEDETHFQNGISGQISGAPKAFNDAQTEAYKDAFDHKRRANVSVETFVKDEIAELARSFENND